MSEISDKVREMFAAGDTVRDAGLTTPEDVERFDDICYGNDLKWQVLDVYRPKKCKGEKLPVLINMHGGGWVYGDKERYQFYCMSLIACVSKRFIEKFCLISEKFKTPDFREKQV